MSQLNPVSQNNESTSTEKVEEADQPAHNAVNLYSNMKVASQSLLDMALLLSNISQLVQVLTIGEQQEFYLAVTSLLCTSILLQVLVGVGLLLIATGNETSAKQNKEMSIMNRLVLVGVFLITVINILVSALSFKNTSNIKTDGSVVSYRKDFVLDTESPPYYNVLPEKNVSAIITD